MLLTVTVLEKFLAACRLFVWLPVDCWQPAVHQSEARVLLTIIVLGKTLAAHRLLV